jgi:HEAT repeat protein
MTDPTASKEELRHLTTSELHRRVLDAEDFDSDERWQAIAVLHNRASEETFALAAELCHSTDPRRVSDGLDLLAQLGSPDRLHQPEARRLIREALRPDLPEAVLVSAASAVGHQDDSEAVPLLVALASHTSPEVRFSVAFGLGGLEGPEVVPALTGLTSDLDSDVRDWSTFALARLRQDDSDAIRAAFWARIEDEDLDTRWEAIAGLVLRQEPKVRGYLEVELRRAPLVDNDHFSLLAAAHSLKDPTLKDLLEPLGGDPE